MKASALLTLPVCLLLLCGSAAAQEVVVTGRLDHDPGQVYPQRLITASGETYALPNSQSKLYPLAMQTNMFRGFEGREVSLRGVVRSTRGGSALAISDLVSPAPEVVEVQAVVLGSGRLRMGDAQVDAFGPAASILGLEQARGRRVTMRGLVFRAPGADAPSAVYVRAVRAFTAGARLRDRTGKTQGWYWPGSRPWLTKLTDDGRIEALGGFVKRVIGAACILPVIVRPQVYVLADRIRFGAVVDASRPARGITGRLD